MIAMPPPVSHISQEVVDAVDVCPPVLIMAVGTFGDVERVVGPASSVSGITMVSPAVSLPSTNGLSASTTMSPGLRSDVVSIVAAAVPVGITSAVSTVAVSGLVTVSATFCCARLSVTATFSGELTLAADAALLVAVTETTGWLPSKLGMVNKLPALSLSGSLPMNASGFASKIAVTAGQRPTGRFSIRSAMRDSESPGCTR